MAFCRRRDERRRDFWRTKVSIYNVHDPRLMHISIETLFRHVRRQFASVFSCAFTKLMYAVCEMFCRRLDALCRFVCIVSHGVSMFLLASFGTEGGVATVGVATLSVGSIMSCRASRGSSCTYIKSFIGLAKIGVATLVVGFPASCFVEFLGSSAQRWHLVSVSQRLSSGLSYVSFMSSRGSCIVEYYRKTYL
jgi:hypothetical protein